MTPQEHARDLFLRLAAISKQNPDDVATLFVWSFEKAIKEEREACAHIALAIDSKRGNEKEIAKAIRAR